MKARINKYYTYTNACNQCAKTFVIRSQCFYSLQ